jgi:hypothetical protein
MKTYSITYDLDKPGQNYAGLIARLNSLGAVRVELSQWLLKTTQTAEQIYDGLSPYADRNDRLLIAGLSGEAAWRNLMVSHDSIRHTIAA